MMPRWLWLVPFAALVIVFWMGLAVGIFALVVGVREVWLDRRARRRLHAAEEPHNGAS